jgi:hypothetical protein
MAWARIPGGVIVALLVLTGAAQCYARSASTVSLRGTVESGGIGLEGYQVALYARFVGPFGRAKVLGSDVTGPFGEFAIDYRLPRRLPRWQQPLLFVRARSGPAMLASALGQAPVAGPVVVNERTTVATGFAFAQFVHGPAIDGNRHGMLNAAHMAAVLLSSFNDGGGQRPRPVWSGRVLPSRRRQSDGESSTHAAYVQVSVSAIVSPPSFWPPTFNAVTFLMVVSVAVPAFFGWFESVFST